MRRVANNMHACWLEYDGGHSNAPVSGIRSAVASIVKNADEPPFKRPRTPSNSPTSFRSRSSDP